MNKILRKKIVIIFAVAMFVFVGLAAPNEAAAGWIIDSIGAAAVSTVMQLIGNFIGYIAGLLLQIAGAFITLGLSLNKALMSSPVVISGWNIVLSFANLGFVLAIIVMAFATILRWESYGMKQILWKLIVAALLVNFSLVIAGSFISVSEILSDYFMTKGGINNPSQWGDAVGSLFQAQALLKVKENYQPTSIIGSLGENIAGPAMSTIASIFFIALFTIIAAITMLAIAAMLFIRYIFLGILLVLSPIVWLLWIFPDTQSYWQKWWDNFLRWTFFAPIMMFFIYLAMFTMYGSGKAALADITKEVSGQYSSTPFTFEFAVIGNFAIVLGLLFGGLMAANSLSITGASMAMGMAQRASKGVGAFAGRRITRVGLSTWDRVRTARRETQGTETTTALQRFGSRLQNIPLLRGIGSAISRQGTEVPRARQVEIENYRQNQLTSLDNQGLIDRATSRTVFLDPMSAAAIGQELARRGLTNNASIVAIPNLMNRYVETAERMGNAQAIYNNRPDLVATLPQNLRRQNIAGVRETDDEIVARIMRGITVANISQIEHSTIGTWNNPTAAPTNDQINVALNLSNSQLGRLGTEGSYQQTEAVRNTIREIGNQFTTGTLSLNQDQQNHLNRIIDHIDNNPNWQNI